MALSLKSGDITTGPFFKAWTRPIMSSSFRKLRPWRLLPILKGEPSPTITWSKDGEILVETNRVTSNNKTQCKSILRISDSNKKDAGMYKCRAENDHGISITEGQVIIEEDAEECFPRKKTPKPGADGGGGDPCMSEKREVKPKDDDSQENAKDEKSKRGR